MSRMGLKVLLLVSVALIVAVHRGRRRNIALANDLLRILEESFDVRSKDSALLGHGLGYGLGYGIDYEIEGDFSSLKVLLTLLPRYAPLYMPIACLIGRRDMLKLTLGGMDISTGVGAVYRDCGNAGLPFDYGEEMDEEEVIVGAAHFLVYAYNPYVAVVLKGVLPFLVGVEAFRYLVIDSREGIASVYLVPRVETLRADLSQIRIALSELRSS